MVILGLEDIFQADDIFVVSQLLQEHNLTEGTLGIGGVLERIENLLESHDVACLLVGGLPHDAVRLFTTPMRISSSRFGQRRSHPLSQLLHDFIPTENGLVDFLTRAHRARSGGVRTKMGIHRPPC